jgi:F-type H+-transporting ATPase subunit delta
MAAFASRYARALADVVIAQHLDPNATTVQLNSFADLVTSNPDLRNIWENPGVPNDQKIRLLDAIVAREHADKYTRNFIAVLISHRRIGAIREIVEQFVAEMDVRLGFAQAEITSARLLSNNERRDLEQQVSQLTGKQVRAVYQQDPALIGGAIVRVGSTIYDGSVRGQLERLKEELATA